LFGRKARQSTPLYLVGEPRRLLPRRDFTAFAPRVRSFSSIDGRKDFCASTFTVRDFDIRTHVFTSLLYSVCDFNSYNYSSG
jgi:hypothetical protein